MSSTVIYLGIGVLVFLGFVVGWGLCAIFSHQKRARAIAECEAAKNAQLAELSQTLAAAQTSAGERDTKAAARIATLETQLEQERKALKEKLAVLEEAQKRFGDAFKALSADALRNNNNSFLEIAKSILEKNQESAKGDLEKRQSAIDALVRPMRESLDKVDAKINDLEKARTGAYEALTTQVRQLGETQNYLRSETSNLVRALRSPIVRGRWGEIQLRRVVELAGMVDHCDFFEQTTVQTEEGRMRPDLVVHLPAGKTVVVDAKASLNAYLEALEAPNDEARISRLQHHAAQVRTHIEKLSRKAYWEQFENTPDFVILFLPGEMFFSAALERDPMLIEFGAEKKIILATPTTLIALLRAVCYGWRQEKLAQNASEIRDLGSELYKRFADLSHHFTSLGKSLNNAVDAFNKAAGNIETRVFVSARKFRDLHAAPLGVEIEPLEPVEQIARELQAPELLPRLPNENGESA
ncbi:MAG TPA: DNA recombination protein RmuC [Chthoniobacterales bacterium]